jgi:predicted RNase H-like nuclease
MVTLFDLTLTLKYKAKRGRTDDTRKVAFDQLLVFLESLAFADPAVDVTTSPRWRALGSEMQRAIGTAALDRVEDELDAYLCAYIALYYWTHGAMRCAVIGDVESGYIVTPVTVGQRQCLEIARAMV